jgi:hypothetical protein
MPAASDRRRGTGDPEPHLGISRSHGISAIDCPSARLASQRSTSGLVASGTNRTEASPRPPTRRVRPARGSAASHPPPLRLGAQPPRASPRVRDRRRLRAGCRRSGLGRTADVPAGPASHRRRLGRAHRAGAPLRDPMVPARSAPRRRCRRRHGRSRKQWFLSGRERPDHALTSPTACLLPASRAAAAILCTAALRARVPSVWRRHPADRHHHGACGDGRQEPAHFEPEVRKREKARMASPA